MKNSDNIFQLSEDWGKIEYGNQIVVYGTGRIGRRVLPSLLQEFTIPLLIDKKDEGKTILGINVFGVEDGIKSARRQGLKIIVTTMRGSYMEIASVLGNLGLQENVDFCIFERFAQEWNLRWHNRCVLAKIDTVITSRCTLKCRNCNIFISHMDKAYDIPYEILKKNFDIFFESIDYVYEYTLLGGEPFKHERIVEIIQYLAIEYRDKIGKINLISNGTVIPDDNTMKVLRKYEVSVHISDYSAAVPYSNRLQEVRTILEKYGIEYYVIPNNVWKDIVYPEMTYTSLNPKEHMFICGHSTHSVGNGRLYWCDPAYAAEQFMKYQSEDGDYLDLESNKESNSKYDASLNIIKYLLGDINGKGCMSLCKSCAGIGKDNKRIVKAGVQAKNHEQCL